MTAQSTESLPKAEFHGLPIRSPLHLRVQNEVNLPRLVQRAYQCFAVSHVEEGDALGLAEIEEVQSGVLVEDLAAAVEDDAHVLAIPGASDPHRRALNQNVVKRVCA